MLQNHSVLLRMMGTGLYLNVLLASSGVIWLICAHRQTTAAMRQSAPTALLPAALRSFSTMKASPAISSSRSFSSQYQLALPPPTWSVFITAAPRGEVALGALCKVRIVPGLRMEKLKSIQMKWLAQDHPGNIWQAWHRAHTTAVCFPPCSNNLVQSAKALCSLSAIPIALRKCR